MQFDVARFGHATRHCARSARKAAPPDLALTAGAERSYSSAFERSKGLQKRGRLRNAGRAAITPLVLHGNRGFIRFKMELPSEALPLSS